jgi:hypothetical protein
MLGARGYRRLFLRLLAAGLALAPGARAEPDPCARTAPVSPCFDSDPLWIPTAPTPFTTVPSAHVLAPHTLGLLVAADYSNRPVVFVAPSPHPSGQEIDVVRATSTLTLGARYGLFPGLDVGVALPFVPFQTGAGTQSVTDQHGEPLATVALRDPRLELGSTLLGRERNAPFALGTRLTLALPLGTEHALAGTPSLTVAPALTAEFELGRLALGADLGWRIARAVNVGTVREGSSVRPALAAAVTLSEHPGLVLGAEAWLTAHVSGRPPGVPESTLDLPAEWLASVRLAPRAAWSFAAAGGSGIPLSKVRAADGSETHALGVTSPDVRVLLAARCTLDSL